MKIEILHPGLCTTIQDQGRVEYQDKGMPVAGFMDVSAATLANLLVNNTPNTALLEMQSLGAKLKVHQPTYLAITGANMQAKVNGEYVVINKMILIPKNAILSFKGAINGVYAYISFAGGIAIESVLGSTSTYLPAKIGGFKGRSLLKGDIIPLNNKQLSSVNTKVKNTIFKNDVLLECFRGPEWDFLSVNSQQHLLKNSYIVSKDSNRIGIRLEGTTVEFLEKNEIISSAIIKGTVQITKAGQPIVMMADAPTTGGYLRVLNLSQKSCNLLAQVQIGGRVQFTLINF